MFIYFIKLNKWKISVLNMNTSAGYVQNTDRLITKIAVIATTFAQWPESTSISLSAKKLAPTAISTFPLP